MAAPFITIRRDDSAATHAQRILQINAQIKALRESLESLVAESFQMFDGDGSNVAHFTLNATKYGVATNTEAQTVFNLLNGTMLAINGDSQNANAVELATRVG